MGGQRWCFVRRPDGDFASLRADEYELFQLGGRRLNPRWARHGALYIVEVFIEELQSGTEQVANCLFRRHRVAPDGSRAAGDGAAHMELAVLEAALARARVRADPEYPNLIQAEERFRARQLNNDCSWAPTHADERRLADAIVAYVREHATALEEARPT